MSLPHNIRQEIKKEIARQLEGDPCDPCKPGKRPGTATSPLKLGDVRVQGGQLQTYDGQLWVPFSLTGGGVAPAAPAGLTFPLTFPIQF